MTIKLYDIQQKQVEMSHRNYMLIMKQGTGKSYTACGLYENWANSSPVVVLCPKSVYDTKQWETTLKTYFEGNVPDFEIFKTDGINKLPPDYFKGKYILIDEGHKYKALSTNRGAKLRVMLSQAEGFCFLTGTPANGKLERTDNGYLLHGGKWEDMANYMAIFEFWRKVRGERTIFDVYHEKFKGEPFTFKTITPATTSRGIMQVIRLSAKVLRGKQGQRYFNNYQYDKYHPVLSHWLASVASDVITLDDVAELPEMSEKTVNFKSCTDYRKSLQSYQKDDKIIFDSDMERRAWQRQNQNTKAKCEWLKEFCDDSDENTVIFYNFNSELEVLREICKKAGKEIHEINGHSKDKDVLLAKERINKTGSSNVICLVQVASGGAGLELQGAPIAIWWSLPDSYINFEQSQFRNYRIGQTKKTLRYYLIVSGTVDVSIKKSMDEKSDWKADSYRD